MIQIDPKSQLVRADTDIEIGELDNKLSREGFTLNYWTPPDNQHHLAEVLRHRLPNVYYRGFGGIEELCVQIRLVNESGKVFMNKLAPRSATGPSLKNLAIGTADLVGVPIEAVLKIFPKPQNEAYALLLFPNEDKRASFWKSFLRLRLTLAMAEILPAPEGASGAGEEDSGGFSIAIADWGNRELVEAKFDLLAALAMDKKGMFVLVEDPKRQEGLLQRLKEQAVLAWKSKGEEKFAYPKVLQALKGAI